MKKEGSIKGNVILFIITIIILIIQLVLYKISLVSYNVCNLKTCVCNIHTIKYNYTPGTIHQVLSIIFIVIVSSNKLFSY